MTYQALIVDTQTGRATMMGCDPLEYFEATRSLWAEGKFSCDCKRGAFHEQVFGPTSEAPCGTTRYRVPYLLLSDGTKVMIDEGSDENKDS